MIAWMNLKEFTWKVIILKKDKGDSKNYTMWGKSLRLSSSDLDISMFVLYVLEKSALMQLRTNLSWHSSWYFSLI